MTTTGTCQHGQPAGSPCIPCARLVEQSLRHHPTLSRTSRHGCWSWCACGWKSVRWTSIVGAHLEFGAHLVDVATDARPEEAR